MYCTNCGSEIPDDANFCPFCSKIISNSYNPPVQPSPAIQSSQPTEQTSPYSPPKTSKNTGIKVAAIFIFLIIGIVLIYSGFQSLSRATPMAITLLVIGTVMILCIAGSICGKSGGGGGGCDCGGCDCGGCDCGGCDC